MVYNGPQFKRRGEKPRFRRRRFPRPLEIACYTATQD